MTCNMSVQQGTDQAAFREAIDAASIAAATAWGYPPAPLADAIQARLGDDVVAGLGAALRTGVLLIEGSKFRLAGLPDSKGPYALFSQNRAGGLPTPNWEYFVQVAEYARLVGLYGAGGYTIGFEDGLMDVSVRRDASLIWCVEVKETRATAERLLARLEALATDVPLLVPDRANDPLRKAKYLLNHRPPFFSLVAVGYRRQFAIKTPSTTSFELIPLREEPQLEGLGAGEASNRQ